MKDVLATRLRDFTNTLRRPLQNNKGRMLACMCRVWQHTVPLWQHCWAWHVAKRALSLGLQICSQINRWTCSPAADRLRCIPCLRTRHAVEIVAYGDYTCNKSNIVSHRNKFCTCESCAEDGDCQNKCRIQLSNSVLCMEGEQQ